MKIHSIKTIIPGYQIPQSTYVVGTDLLGNLDTLEVLKKLHISQYVLLSDKIVFSLFGKKVIKSLEKSGINVFPVVIPAGEKYKSIDSVISIVEIVLKHKIDRSAALIALGGGVITDLGGFIASILFRGITSIYLPTTLLAQVDASIGSKTGLNFSVEKNAMYKNMIGTFYQPFAVISDISTLKTLPQKEIKNGLGEMAKYWVGWNSPSFSQMEMMNDLKNLRKDLSQIIQICQEIKLNVIQKDPRDETGVREQLNLGHTFAHALETCSDLILSHGEAVSIGIAAAAKLSIDQKLLDPKIAKRIIEILEKLHLPTSIKDLDVNKMMDAMKYDKKGEGNFVLIKDIGKLITRVHVPQMIVKKVLSKFIHN